VPSATKNKQNNNNKMSTIVSIITNIDKTQQTLTNRRISIDMEDLEWEEYNGPYKIEKLEHALISCGGLSPGPDGIHYKMLKELSLSAKE
jgi:hypothetical protein